MKKDSEKEKELFYSSKEIVKKNLISDSKVSVFYKSYHDSGNLKESLHFKKNKLEGVAIFYDENGKKLQRAMFKNNLLHGLMISYDNGKPITSTTYLDGKEHGIRLIFAKNRNISAIMHYKFGKLNGMSTFFDEDKNKIREANYRDGELHGEVRNFHKNGLVISNESFQDGVKI